MAGCARRRQGHAPVHLDLAEPQRPGRRSRGRPAHAVHGQRRARDSFLGSGSDEIVRQALITVIGVDWKVEAVVDPSTDPGAAAPATPADHPARPASRGRAAASAAVAGASAPASAEPAAVDTPSADDEDADDTDLTHQTCSRASWARRSSASTTPAEDGSCRAGDHPTRDDLRRGPNEHRGGRGAGPGRRGVAVRSLRSLSEAPNSPPTTTQPPDGVCPTVLPDQPDQQPDLQLPGGDLSSLLQQAQQMQSGCCRPRRRSPRRATARPPGALSTPTVTGSGELAGLQHRPAAIDPADPEMLADLVLAAIRAANDAAGELQSRRSACSPRASPAWAAASARRRPLGDPRVRRCRPGPDRRARRLPGVGPKSAQRIAFHLLAADPADVRRLVAALTEVKAKVRFCATCGNVAEEERCRICRDPRRDRLSAVRGRRTERHRRHRTDQGVSRALSRPGRGDQPHRGGSAPMTCASAS